MLYRAQTRGICSCYVQSTVTSAPSPVQDDVGGGGTGISPRQRHVCRESPCHAGNGFKGSYDLEKGVKRVRNMLDDENKRTIL